MARLQTTIGSLMVNSVLPEELRDYNAVIDKAAMSKLLRTIAQKYPEKYRDISHRLLQIGKHISFSSGGDSFGLRHLTEAKVATQHKKTLLDGLTRILSDDSLSDDERDKQLVKMTGKIGERMSKDVLEESLQEDNPLARQIRSGSRGNAFGLAALRGSELLFTDHRDRVIPVPIRHSYSQGYSPAEYWAGSYGTRKGLIDLKMCLVGGTLVLMADYSEKPIKKIRVGDWVMGADTCGNMFPVQVTAVYANGHRECFRYRFRKGGCRQDDSIRELGATEDHKVLAQIKDGRPGSTYAHRSVYEPTALPMWRARVQKNPRKNTFSAYPAQGAAGIGRPEPHALLAGLMLGDGCMTPKCHGCYTLSCADDELLQLINQRIGVFNLRFQPMVGSYSAALVEIDKTKRVVIRKNNRNCFAKGHLNPSKRWLRECLGEYYAHEKTLPGAVWGWDDAAIGNLLAGIFLTDGGVETRKNGCSIYIRSTSKQLLLGVQRLLELRLGIWTSSLNFVPVEKCGPNATHDQWRLTINHPLSVSRFAARVPLFGVKARRLQKARLYQSRRADGDQYGFKIIDKQSMGLCETFDLEVACPDHLFVLANGLIVSNSTRDAGFLSKQLSQIVHRAIVTSLDADKDPETLVGLPSRTDDGDNEGALLSAPAGGYPRNTILTPKILADLRHKGIDDILVRSPMVNGPGDGSVYARDVGIREFGRLPNIGENPALTASQALSEPLTQAQICLVRGTLVRMADWSVRPIEQIRPGDWVLGADRHGNTFPVQVLRCFDNGLRNCHQTAFQVGLARQRITLESTLDHKILASLSTYPFSATDTIEGIYPVGQKAGKGRFAGLRPAGFTAAGLREEPFALLMGLGLGDGCYTNSVNGFHLSCFDPMLITDIAPRLSALNLKTTLLAGQRGYYRVSQIDQARTAQDATTGRFNGSYRNPAMQMLVRYGMAGKYAYEKIIPHEAYSWNNASVAELIAGLMVTDGSVYVSEQNKAKGGAVHISFGSTSLRLVEQVKELLEWRFGIYASIPKPSGADKRKHVLYSFVITFRDSLLKFAANIPLYGVKRHTLVACLATWRPRPTASRNRLYRKEQIAIGHQYTHDLEVAHEDHLFVLANGLIVSNSSKHTGGVAGAGGSAAISGFDWINQLVQVPKTFKGGAVHATVDGHVESIDPAPAGGKYISVDGTKHYVGEGFEPVVKPGDNIEAGDMLSEGEPNPAVITEHKGVGEGRRYFLDAFRKAYANARIGGHRRNIELLAKGLINHVRLTDELDDLAPDDVVPYDVVEKKYRPRDGYDSLPTARAVGKYLERPYLHYSIGTKIRPSVVKQLKKFGVENIDVHADPPPFEPEMIRGMANLQHDPDWLTRMFGSGLKGSVLEGAQRGAISDPMGTSFVPALATGQIGKGKVRTPRDYTPAELAAPKTAAELMPEQNDGQGFSMAGIMPMLLPLLEKMGPLGQMLFMAMMNPSAAQDMLFSGNPATPTEPLTPDTTQPAAPVQPPAPAQPAAQPVAQPAPVQPQPAPAQPQPVQPRQPINEQSDAPQSPAEQSVAPVPPPTVPPPKPGFTDYILPVTAAVAPSAAASTGMGLLGQAAAKRIGGTASLWATPINGALELVDGVGLLPEMLGGKRETGFGWSDHKKFMNDVTPDNTILGFKDPTNGLLSYAGAAINANMKPIRSLINLPGEAYAASKEVGNAVGAARGVQQGQAQLQHVQQQRGTPYSREALQGFYNTAPDDSWYYDNKLQQHMPTQEFLKANPDTDFQARFAQTAPQGWVAPAAPKPMSAPTTAPATQVAAKPKLPEAPKPIGRIG